MKSQLSVLLLVIVLILVVTVPSAAAPTVRPCAADTSYDPACDMDQNGVIDVMDIQLAARPLGTNGHLFSRRGAALF
ncbi:MAG: hypothetical protein V9G12_25835 [Microthrixaceae bacterium]